jgi:hypothetical protein
MITRGIWKLAKYGVRKNVPLQFKFHTHEAFMTIPVTKSGNKSFMDNPNSNPAQITE